MTDPQLRRFARQLVGLEERLHHLETVPQLAHSSIDDHGVPVYDKDGNLASIIGKQQDGTWGAPPLAGPAPGPPSGVSAVGGAGIVHVHWDGTFAEGTAPLDFDAVEILVDGALAGAMPDRDGGSITIRADQGTRYISARVRTLVPRHSRTTSPFSVEVRAPAEMLFDDTAERAAQLEEDLRSTRDDLGVARARLLALSERPPQPDHDLPDPPTAASGVGVDVGEIGAVRDAGGDPVSWWQWDGATWRQVEFFDTLVARVAQILQLDVAQLTVTEGASINQLVALAIAGATAEFQEAFIQNLRSNGAVMEEAVIGDLAANIITSGLFRTAASGQRLEIDSNGLIMWGVDPDGVEYEMVRLGPNGVNLLTIGDTTVAPDGIQSPSAAFEQLSVGGEGLQEVLARYPRGMRAWGQLVGSSQYDSNTTIMARRGELQTTLEPNRLYRMRLSEHLVEVSGGVNTNIVEELRYTYDAVPVNIQNTPDPGTYRGVFARNPVFAGSATNVNGMEFLLNTGDWAGERTFWLMWLMRTENAGRPVKVLATSFYSPIMSIEDLGPAQSDILKRWNDGNGGEAQDTAPTVRRFTKVYTATGFGGDTSGGDVVQGQYASYGNRSGGWTFPSMTGDLAGATIERIRVFLYANHWYYNAGGTASIRATNGSHKGHTGPVVTSAGWPRNAGRWVTLPASMHDGFKAGTYKGIGVQTSNTSLTYYGRFAGNPSDPARKAKIEIQFRK